MKYKNDPENQKNPISHDSAAEICVRDEGRLSVLSLWDCGTDGTEFYISIRGFRKL